MDDEFGEMTSYHSSHQVQPGQHKPASFDLLDLDFTSATQNSKLGPSKPQTPESLADIDDLLQWETPKKENAVSLVPNETGDETIPADLLLFDTPTKDKGVAAIESKIEPRNEIPLDRNDSEAVDTIENAVITGKGPGYVEPQEVAPVDVAQPAEAEKDLRAEDAIAPENSKPEIPPQIAEENSTPEDVPGDAQDEVHDEAHDGVEASELVALEEPDEEEDVEVDGDAGSLSDGLGENLFDADTHKEVNADELMASRFRDSQWRLSENPFASVLPFADLESLINLSQVSKETRALVTRYSVWPKFVEALRVQPHPQKQKAGLSEKDFSAANILDSGPASTPFATVARVQRLLKPLVDNPELASEYGTVEQTLALRNALRLVGVLEADEETRDRVAQKAKAAQDALIAEITQEVSSSSRRSSINSTDDTTLTKSSLSELLESCRIWQVSGLGLANIEEQAFRALFSGRFPDLRVDDAFTFTDGDGDATLDVMARQTSERKLTTIFEAVAAFLVTSLNEFAGPSSPIPAASKETAWAYLLSRVTGNVVVFVQALLVAAATEVSELEYLQTVIRVSKALQSVGTNQTLRDLADRFDMAVEATIDATVLRPMLEEYADRELAYVDAFAKNKVQAWDESATQRESETEELLWSSVPKRADKTNFLSSFKWAFGSNNAAGPQPELKTTVDSPAVPATEFEAQTAVLASKLKGMEKLVSFELAVEVIETCKQAMGRLRTVGKLDAAKAARIFAIFLGSVGRDHIEQAFGKAVKVLNSYDPKKYGRLLISMEKPASSGSQQAEAGADKLGPNSAEADGATVEDSTETEATPSKKPQGESDLESPGDGATFSVETAPTQFSYAVEPLAVFTELVNIGDLVQQMVHVFFEEELVSSRLVRPNNFGDASVNAKRRFEKMLDDYLAEGLSRGIDVLMDQVEFTLMTEQLGSDYLPVPNQPLRIGQTAASSKVIGLVKSHLDLLRDSTEKSLFDVFQQEVGMRLFAALTKHMKRQIISVDGAINLISDTNAYHAFITTLKQKNLAPYYEALRQVAQLFLIDKKDAKQLGVAIGDTSRYNNVINTEDILEFVKRRRDWPLIKAKVEKVLYGMFDCVIM